MLAHLEPSVELTGGPWYTDNELDTEFIKLLSTACLHYVRDRVSLVIDWHFDVYARFPLVISKAERQTILPEPATPICNWGRSLLSVRTTDTAFPEQEQDYGD